MNIRHLIIASFAFLLFLPQINAQHEHKVPTRKTTVKFEDNEYAIVKNWFIKEEGGAKVGLINLTVTVEGSTMIYSIRSKGLNKSYSDEGLSFVFLKKGKERGHQTKIRKVHFSYRGETKVRGKVDIDGTFSADQIRFELQGGTWKHD